MIDREDMLELTRRMTVARSNFTRIAGVYYDEEGYVDGTFNTNFLNLSSSDKTKNLELAKAVLFSKTNEELKEIEIPSSARGKDKMITLLDAVCSENLKNDALMEIFYEIFGEQIPFETTFALYIFRGSYDIPIKGTDNESEWESDREDMKIGEQLCYVKNLDNDDCSEFGYICFQKNCGGLMRTA